MCSNQCISVANLNEIVIKLCVNLNVVVHEPTGICEVWVFGVDVSQLNRHKIVNLEHSANTRLEKIHMHIKSMRGKKQQQTNHLIGDWEPLPEKRSDHFYYGIMQLWKPK